jgi:hypothetical protein
MKEPLRITVWQWPEKNGIDNTEDGGSSADAEDKCDKGRGSESGTERIERSEYRRSALRFAIFHCHLNCKTSHRSKALIQSCFR